MKGRESVSHCKGRCPQRDLIALRPAAKAAVRPRSFLSTPSN